MASEQLSPTGERGFFYRIPATGAISVVVGPDQKAFARAQIPQFGVVTALPDMNAFKSYSSKYDVSFYSDSGALKKFSATLKSVDTAAFGEASTAAGGVLDALAKKRAADAATEAAEEAAQDELAQLKRQRQILEEQKAILELEAVLEELSEGEQDEE